MRPRQLGKQSKVMSTVIPPPLDSNHSYGVRRDGAGDDLLRGRLISWAVSDGGGTAGDCEHLSCEDGQSSGWDTGVVLTAVVEVLGNMLAGRGQGGEKAEGCYSRELHCEIWIFEKVSKAPPIASFQSLYGR